MKTKRFFALALTVIMMFSLLPHAFAAEDITAMLAEYQKQAQAMQQEVIAQQEAARQDLALAQQQATQQVQQAQADMQKAYKQATCKHEWKRTYTEDKDETDGVHDEVTVCIDCEKELERVTVEDEKEQSATLRTALKAASTLGETTEISTFEELAAAMSNGGSYKLTQVINVGDNKITTNTIVTLDLNGKELSDNGAGGLFIKGNGNLTIKDSEGNGLINYLDAESGTLNIYGGSIYSLILSEDAVVNIYGGEVENLHQYGGSATIYGGTIEYINGTVNYGVTAVASPAEGGSVTADKATAGKNESVTLTVTPKGYELDTLTYTPQGGTAQKITFTKGEDGKYTGSFTMPAAPVTVTATFKAVGAITTADELQAALNAGGTVTLTQDITSDKKIYIGNDVTLNLNGHSLNFEEYNHGLEINNGKLTLMGSGTVGRLTVSEGGRAEVSGGEVINPINVHGGNVEVSGGTVNTIYVWKGVSGSTGGSAKVSGGMVRDLTVREDGNSAEVSGGTVGHLSVESGSRAEVYGGTIHSLRGDGTIVFGVTATPSPAGSGTVTADKATAGENETVTLTVTPKGYELDELTVSYTDGEEQKTITPEKDTTVESGNKYTFTMPRYPVTVTATFKAIQKPKLTITAIDQTYVYNGQTQGEGDTAYEDDAEIAKKVTVEGLQDGHSLASIVLDGQGTDVGVYTGEDGIVPKGARIVDEGGNTVTENYDITYVNGKLIITANIAVAISPENSGTVTADKAAAKEGEIVTLTATPEEGYELVSITYTPEGGTATDITSAKSFTMPAEKVTVTATFKLKTFTIKFVNDDGTELQSVTVAYGKTPAYTGETPEKPADTDYTYTFSGWDPAIASVEGDATYTATFTAVKNEYTFTYTWSEDNSTVTAVRTCTNNPDLSVTEVVKTTSEGTAATCEAAGKMTYTAVFTNTAFEKQTKTVETPALGHKWKVSEELWAGDYSSVTVTFVCKNDPTHTKKETAAASESISGSVVTYTAAITLDGKEFPFSKSVDISGQGYVFTHTTQVWVKGSREGATFRVTRLGDDSWTYRLFTGIRVDGAPVSAYSKAPGSIILTLHPAYLESLSVGYHTLAVYFTDGEATADFLILPAGGSYYNNSTSERYTYVPPSNVPRTGDESNLALWGALAIVSAAGIALLIVRKRKKT